MPASTRERYAQPPYHLRLVRHGQTVAFCVNDLPILRFEDDGARYGTTLGGGKMGFRRMAPMVGRDANLRVYDVELLNNGPT